jgi:hypothetical protein
MLLEQFNSNQNSLADMIMKKFNEKESTMPQPEAEKKEEEEELNLKVKELYVAIGEQLHKYTSGKVPKPFKGIPQCESWQKVNDVMKVVNQTNKSSRLESTSYE